MKVYDLEELSEMLKMNRRTLQRYVREGKLKVSKVGRKYIVTEDDLKEFIESQRVTSIAEDTEEKK
jgi:excisionase family DNA binding protein